MTTLDRLTIEATIAEYANAIMLRMQVVHDARRNNSAHIVEAMHAGASILAHRAVTLARQLVAQ